ncbi:MAG TPA: PBP1A family penicillin-binding protein [Candidatus Saccharimonadales bacterium]|nr:PBP1A family penicillin-binding protein [Candidatus Saccharimonadales bacterium]
MQDFKSRRRFHKGLKGFLHTLLHLLPGSKGQSDIVLWSRLAKYSFFGLIGIIIIGVGAFIWFGRDLPQPGKLINNSLAQSTRIYDRNGTLLYSAYKTQNRIYVKLSDIPANLQHATISIEDKNFYTNSGFSLTGYLRSALDLIIYRKIVSGGSTLTQQLVKNVLLTQQQTFSRKIKELMLSLQVDKLYSKNQILEMYLNDVPYGGANIGVEAASEAYFGKHVKDLDLGQSAFLAGLPQAPSTYDPFGGHTYYLARTSDVLDAMRQQGYITQSQENSAYDEIKNTKFTQDMSIRAPHFVMYVLAQLNQMYGEQEVQNGGLQVTTSLDYNIQQSAENAVKTELDKLGKSYHVTNGAVVVRDPKTGDILAMVGSKDYYDTSNDGNFNASTGSRQPGSSLKPIMYATAFEKGYTPASEIMDVQTEFPGATASQPYIPGNYNGKFNGPIQLRFALGNSLNIPAVKMLANVGIKDVMQNAYNMGIQNWEPTSENIANVGLSLVLGGRETSLLDETTAYGVFATGGYRHDPVAILKVTNSNGSTLYQANPGQGTRVMPENITFLISHILSDNNARLIDFGPYNSLVVPGQTVSAKTGTTNDFKDNWTLGYNSSYVVGVWVGNNDDTPMGSIASGITGAAPIWNDVMRSILKGKPSDTWLQHPPSDVVAMSVDATFGGLPYPGMPTRTEYFIKGTEPTTQSPVYQQFNGKLYYVVRENDPVSTDGVNRWQIGIDNWIHQNHSAADEAWYPPDDLLKKLNITPTPPLTPTPTP